MESGTHTLENNTNANIPLKHLETPKHNNSHTAYIMLTTWGKGQISSNHVVGWYDMKFRQGELVTQCTCKKERYLILTTTSYILQS
jgi:hypothetical protein